MTDADKPGFVAALAELASLKAGAKLTVEQYGAWWNAMRGVWTLDDFRDACARLSREVEFMPNPFHFEQLRKAARLTSGEAWALVRQAARVGAPCPADPDIAAAVLALGGMRAIGMTHSDQMPFLERRFAEHYESIADSENIREEMPRIAGGSRRLIGVQPIAKLLAGEIPAPRRLT
jgi:hypothetical protein